jgi:hypothetical protein
MQYSLKAINFTPGQWAQGGAGVTPEFPWYAAPYLDMTAAQLQSLAQGVGLTLGDTWWNNGTQASAEGNCFMLVKANAALTVGQFVAMDAPQSGTYTTAGSTAAVTKTNITEAGAVNSEIDNFLAVIATGQTIPQIRRIKGNTTGATASYTIALPDYLRPSSPNDTETWATTPTNGDALTIIRPFNVKVCTSALQPIGVALGAVTSGNYTIIQIAGLAGISAVTGLVAMQPAIISATAGAAGPAPANFSTTVPTIYGGAIIPMMATAGTVLAPAMINFIGA